MTSWHLDPGTAQRYASGTAGQVFSASAEAHLAACASCRALLVPLVDSSRLDRIHRLVQEHVDRPRTGPVERLLLRLGVRPDTARLLAATPALRASWLLAVCSVLGFAVVAAGAGPDGTLLFLTLAPMLPVAGVAAAYGRGVDAMHEIVAAAPYSGFRLVLLRSAAVLTSTVVLAGTAELLLPGPALTGVAWLLPALALTSLTLALSLRLALTKAGAMVAIGWLGAVTTAQLDLSSRYAGFGAVGQLTCLAVAAGSVTVLLTRQGRYAIVFGRTS